MSRTKFACLFLAVLLVPLFGLLALPFTATGTQFLVSKMNQYTPLRVDYGSGSLGSRLKLNAISLSQDGLSVDAGDVELVLGLRCLLVSKVCIEFLDVESFRVELDDSTTSPEKRELVESGESERAEPTQFEFPVEVEVALLKIRSTEIIWTNGRLVSGPVEGAVSASEKRLTLVNWRTSNTALHLVTSEESEPNIDAAIDFPELRLPFELLVSGLALESPGWSFDEIQHQHQAIELSLRWTGTTLTLEKLFVSSEGWGALNLSGNIEAEEVWQLDIEANAALTTPPLGSWSHDRTLKVAALGKLSWLELSAQLMGDQALTVDGYANVTDTRIPFEVALNGRWTDSLALGEILGSDSELPDLNLLSPWVVTASGSVDQQTVSLSGNAEGLGYRQLALSIGVEHADGEIRVNSLSLFDEFTDSRLDTSGTVSVKDDVRWDFDIRSSGFEFPVIAEIPSGRVDGNLKISGEVSDVDWLVHLDQVDLQGEVDGAVTTARGKFSLNSDLEIFDTQFNLNAADTALTVVASQEKPPELNLEVPDIGRWVDDARGSLALRATLENNQQRLVFSGSAQKLRAGDVTVPSATIEGELDVRTADSLQLRVSSGQLDFQQTQLRDIVASIIFTGDKQEFSLSVAGDLETDLKLAGGFDNAVWSGQLSPAIIVTSVGAWNLEEAVAVHWQKDLLEGSVAPHCWMHEQASLCLRDLQKAEAYIGAVDLRGNLRILQPLAPPDTSLVGDAAALLEFHSDTQGGLRLKASTTISEGRISRTVAGTESVLVWDKIEGRGSFDPEETRVNLEFWRDKRQQLSVDASVPRQEDETLDGRLLFDQFDFGSLAASFLPVVVDPRGVLDGELLLAGTGGAPLLNGEMTLSEGQFSLVENPTVFHALSANITASGDRANLKGSALVGNGQTELSGSFVWKDEPALDLTVTGEGQTVLLPPGLEARISEDLRLLASSGKVEVTGEITVHEGMLEHEQLPAGSVDVSADVVEVDYEGNVLRDEEVIDLVADLKLNILNAFKVVGPGLTTTVGGELELKKRSAQPLQLFGELNIIDGQVEALGQVLDIKKGSLSFVGAPDNPDLNIRAQREIPAEKIQVGLELLGSLDAFSFNVYSTPALPESEAMSYLIRGRGLDQGAQVDGTALALSLGLGAVNKIGLFEGLNQLPGVNNISFGTEGEAGDTTATVSAYLGERLYLSYGIGVYEPLNVLTARLYLQTQLWLEVVSSLVSSADVYYSVDIE